LALAVLAQLIAVAVEAVVAVVICEAQIRLNGIARVGRLVAQGHVFAGWHTGYAPCRFVTLLDSVAEKTVVAQAVIRLMLAASRILVA
jgi:hypothetical protein